MQVSQQESAPERKLGEESHDDCVVSPLFFLWVQKTEINSNGL
jgi:hypothetical protein